MRARPLRRKDSERNCGFTRTVGRYETFRVDTNGQLDVSITMEMKTCFCNKHKPPKEIQKDEANGAGLDIKVFSRQVRRVSKHMV